MNIDFRNPIWKRGRPAELFVVEEAFIEKFISEFKLRALSEESLDQLSPVAGGVITDGRLAIEPQLANQRSVEIESMERSSEVKIKPPNFPGGLRTPHIHFKGEVFLLNIKQWQNFSGFVKKDIQKRLDRAESIPFEQMMDLAGVVRDI